MCIPTDLLDHLYVVVPGSDPPTHAWRRKFYQALVQSTGERGRSGVDGLDPDSEGVGREYGTREKYDPLHARGT